MVVREAATRLQSLWRGRSVRRQRSVSEASGMESRQTRQLLPTSGGSTIWRAKADSPPAWVAPADGTDAPRQEADGAALVDASNYASAHDLTRLTEFSELPITGTEIGKREGLASPGGAAARRLQLRALAMVAMSGVFFALQGASVKLAQDEPGGGTFEMVTARGMVQQHGRSARRVIHPPLQKPTCSLKAALQA